MKHISDLKKSLIEPERIGKEISDFPSLEHSIAWEIATYFDEPYGFWVRQVKRSWLLAGQVQHEFEVLKGRTAYTPRQKVKMLMAVMFPKGTGKTPQRGV